MTGHQLALLVIGATFVGVSRAAYSYTRYRLALRRIRRNVVAYAADPANFQGWPDA